MKDAYEVLYQKEAELVRVRQEVESLRVVASLLTDDTSANNQGLVTQEKKPAETEFAGPFAAAATGTNGLSTSSRQPKFWRFLKPSRR